MYDMKTQATRQGWVVEQSKPVVPDPYTAPGHIVLCRLEGLHPYAVHFFNEQDGGFHSGSYHTDLDEAQVAFNKRVKRWCR